MTEICRTREGDQCGLTEGCANKANMLYIKRSESKSMFACKPCCREAMKGQQPLTEEELLKAYNKQKGL
jgi:hypothetical protein